MERYTEKITTHILLIKQKDIKGQLIITVCYDYVPVAKFNKNRHAERKIAAVELIERHICNKSTAARICGFHRNTINNFLAIKQALGIEALLEENRGLKQPLKYIKQVQQTIKELLVQYPDLSDAQIAKRVSKKLDMDIHRNGVARIRVAEQSPNNTDIIFSKDRLIELSKVSEAIDIRKNDARQLELNFTADEQLEQKKEELEKLDPLYSSNKTEQQLIERLQDGERSPFAGSLMHHLFLNEINYTELMDCLPATNGSTYQYIDILSTLYFSVANELKSIESLKLINACDFGSILGLDRCPDKDVIRKKLHQLAELKPSNKLVDRFARVLLENQRIDDEVFFIDGHFLPYYGLHVIAKGYYTVRRLAMKGNELYVISDLNGRPLFSITESNEIDFRPIILQAADKLIEYGIQRPILTFDRGGYGVHFFSEIDEKADFVTWAKYLTDKQLARINDDDFKECLALNKKKYLIAEQRKDVSESLQTAKSNGRDKPAKIQLRLVTIENIDTGKRIGIYTNNFIKPASSIAYYMLNRWGDSENVYKELMAKFNLNYHPGYDIDELKKQPLVDNPDVATIKKAIRLLHKETAQLSELQQKIQQRLNNRMDKRLSRKLISITKEHDEKIVDIQKFEEKLTTLPDKISIVDLLKGKKMSRCDLEKKKLYDFMQFMLLHSYERLEELLKSYYHDKRDIKPVLRMITRQPGYLKLYGDTLIVLIDRIDREKHRIPAEKLCHKLNRLCIKLNGRVKMKLFFKISKF